MRVVLVALVAVVGCSPGEPVDDGGSFVATRCIAAPADIDFGVPAPSAQPVTRTFSLRNRSSFPLFPELGQPLPPFMFPPPERLRIEPFTEVKLSVSVVPNGLSAVSHVPFKGGIDCPQTEFLLQLRGAGLVSVSPLRLDFGGVALGTTRTLDVVVANSRSTPADVRNLRLTSGGGFKVSLEPFTLPPHGGTHAIPITLDADMPGRRDMTLAMDTFDATFQVMVTGFAGGPVAALSPAVVDAQVPLFGLVPEASFVVRRLTLANPGDGNPSSSRNLELTGPVEVEALEGNAEELCVGAWRDGACVPFELPSGGLSVGRAIDVPLWLRPGTLAPRRWRVHVRSNDVTAPERTAMVTSNSFYPEPCSLSVVAPALDAGPTASVLVGNLELSNTGATDCLVDDVHTGSVQRTQFILPDGGLVGFRVDEGLHRVDAGATLSLPVTIYGSRNITIEGFISLHPLRADGGVLEFPLLAQFH